MEPSKGKWSLYWLARTKPYWLVLSSGLFLGFAFPPSPFNFLALVGFVPLFLLVEGTPARVFEDWVFYPVKWTILSLLRLLTFPVRFLFARITGQSRPKLTYHRRIISGNAQIFRYTYLAFFIWNLIDCYWLTFTVQGASTMGEALVYLSGGLLAIIVNPALMAIPFQLYSRVRRTLHPLPAAACLIIFWITFEHLHFRWELTWAWLSLGHAFANTPLQIQYAEFTGIEGISLFILIANLLIYQAIRHFSFTKTITWKRLALPGSWLLLPFLLNFIILAPERDVFQPDSQLRVRIIQPNIDPYHQTEILTRAEHISRFQSLIMQPGIDSIDLVLLPESAIPKSISREQLRTEPLLQPLWEIVDEQDLALVTGFTELQIYTQKEELPVSASLGENGQWLDFFNSATLMRSNEEAQTFQKSKLVPMVERMPFLTQVKWVENQLGTDLTGGFSYGLPKSSLPFTLKNDTKLGMMICYESQFGDFVRRQTLKGASLLSIITNDGWWGKSSGHVQHASFSRLRAIENRRDLVRCANTGISMFVDQKGGVRQATAWWEQAVIDQKVNLYDSQTFYVRNGDFLGFWAGWIGLFLYIMVQFLPGFGLHKKYPQWFAKEMRPR